MKINTDSKKIEEILTRGVEEVIDKDHLFKRLKSGEELRIKHGVDPTGPKIHIGRATQFLKLKDLQDLGHKIVLIIGDFTAQIGDASDKNAARRILSENEVKANMKNYREQISKILDMDKVEFHYNSEWLDKLNAKDIISLSMNFTAQQMIQRRNFKERWDDNKPIGLHELDYPLLQGYDSVAIKADVEIGGFDQLFNLTVGRDVQQIFKQKPQDIITLKMLIGLDGRKMSTSWGNVINISDDPNEIFGKIMSINDDLTMEYFELCTRIQMKELEGIKKDLKNKKVNPRDIKATLAKEIVSLFYDKQSALGAEKEFEKVFKGKELPTEIPETRITEGKLDILDLLVKTGLTSSKAEAKRLIIQNGVKINEKTEDDWKKIVDVKKGMIIQIGRRKFVKIV